MDNNEALKKVLQEVDIATQAYEKANLDVQQASSLAQKELKARFEQAEISAKSEAEQIWKKTQQKIQKQFSSWSENKETGDLILKAEPRITKVTQELLLELIQG
jgi:vacuolar-type H+-ATPase subunit H